MSLLEGADEPTVDRNRLMRTACLVYLLAATDAHSKNYSLLYSRGSNRPSALAKLLDGVAAQCKTTLRHLEIRERQSAGDQ
jgi:hypothetical protein